MVHTHIYSTTGISVFKKSVNVGSIQQINYTHTRKHTHGFTLEMSSSTIDFDSTGSKYASIYRKAVRQNRR